MAGEAKRFAFELDVDYDRFTREQVQVFYRKIAMEMLSRVVLKSPVDTGRFRGNWTVSLNVPDLSVTDGVDSSGGATIAKGSSVITGMREPQVVYVSNNLPYAQRLEYGHSKQAPAGMVTVTLAEIEAMFARTL